LRFPKLTALLIGITLGFTGVILHNALPPIGLIAALAVTFFGIKLIGDKSGSRAEKVVAGVGWSAIFFTAASTGNSYELLIIGNSTGNFYLFAGFLALLAAIIWPAK